MGRTGSCGKRPTTFWNLWELHAWHSAGDSGLRAGLIRLPLTTQEVSGADIRRTLPLPQNLPAHSARGWGRGCVVGCKAGGNSRSSFHPGKWARCSSPHTHTHTHPGPMTLTRRWQGWLWTKAGLSVRRVWQVPLTDLYPGTLKSQVASKLTIVSRSDDKHPKTPHSANNLSVTTTK